MSSCVVEQRRSCLSGKAAVAVPWRLAAGSPAYQGIANSWNCAAHFEGPRHLVQGAHLQIETQLLEWTGRMFG